MAAIDRALIHLRQKLGSDLLRPEQFDQLARQLGHVYRDAVLPPGKTLKLFVQQIAHGNIAGKPRSVYEPLQT